MSNLVKSLFLKGEKRSQYETAAFINTASPKANPIPKPFTKTSEDSSDQSTIQSGIVITEILGPIHS